MTCDDIKDLILTDYLDDELTPENRIVLKRHLNDCQSCREFVVEAKLINKSFVGMAPVDPPGHIWGQIEEKINENVTPDESPMFYGWGRLLGWMTRPAFVMGAAGLFVLGVFLLQRSGQIAQTNGETQYEYLAALSEDVLGLEEPVDGGYGTDIEQYFL